MRAVAFKQHGDIEVLEEMELPKPAVDEDEVLVAVKACALNHLDLWIRKGLPGPIPMPHILGCEITGVVAEKGKRVTRFKEGERVMIAPGQSCRHCEWCLRGDDPCCAEYRVMGYQSQGGYAEYAKAKHWDVIAIGEGWSLAEWAAVPLVFQTAWHMLFDRARLRPGDDVLIHAAGSGVGSAAIQIAKYAGARVFTTASRDEKLEHARGLGADFTINYKTADFADAVLEATGGRGVDIVVEHIGQDVWKGSLKCLAKNGRLVTCGATSGPVVSLDLRFLFMKQHTVMGSYMGSRSDLLEALKLVERRELRPVVDKVFPLGQAREAQRRMAEREQFGKLVLEP